MSESSRRSPAPSRGKLLRRQRPAAKAAKAAPVPGKRKLKLSAKGLAARKLQGQYLGLLRGLGAGPRARVKKVAREKGVAEALKFAATLK